MQKISTEQTCKSEIFKEQKLTIGVDLGDRWSFYCVLDEAGKIILEQRVSTTPQAMKQTFRGCRKVASHWRQEHIRHRPGGC
jgi:transposase